MFFLLRFFVFIFSYKIDATRNYLICFFGMSSILPIFLVNIIV